MNRHFPILVLAFALAAITEHSFSAETIQNNLLRVTWDQGRFALHAQGQAQPFATGVTVHGGDGIARVSAANDPDFGAGQTLEIAGADGSREVFQLFANIPFVLCHATLVNSGGAALVLNKVTLLKADLDAGSPPAELITLGTGGLSAPDKNPGSYAWLALADPKTNCGIVGGWLTHEHASGVVFSGVKSPHVTLEARAEYGRLRIDPGKSAETETFILGSFADARIGLEAWADAVAKKLAIKLPPQSVVYCTWYDNVHGGSSNARAIAELSAFAARELKPYGFTCVQIDDGWQMGDPKGNGPKKNFSAYNPKGAYPAGMKATADAIAAQGLTAGLWILPFGGSWNDPFFEPHQDWFVKRQGDGKPFDTAWGGTALDMTYPGARDFVSGEIKQAVKQWGYHYLKLDGLSTGCGVKPQYINSGWREDNLGDGVFHDPTATNLDAFRSGLRMIRDSAGAGRFILGCCAPQNMRSYAGVFGLVDAMRMGPDNNGSWDGWFKSSPLYGARNAHLNGRIWWSDPDPIYVRESIPLDSARAIASWNAISGQMISLSDWLPTLPPERLDIIRRVIPGHNVLARPIDLFATQPQRIWVARDERPNHPRRDVLGLFNWNPRAEDMTVTADELGLPPAAQYIAFDFWNRVFLKPFTQSLTISVPGHGCRVLAVRPLLDRPFVLSSSRHVSQGIVEIRKEEWDAQARTLDGISAVVANDPYELRIVAFSPENAWALAGVQLSETDKTAGATVASTSASGFVRVLINSPVNREIAWTISFKHDPKAAPVALSKIEAAVSRVLPDNDTLQWTWNHIDGVDCEIEEIGKGKPALSSTGTWKISGLEPEKEYHFRFTAVDWAGRRSEPVEAAATMPKGPALPPTPPKPTVSLMKLRPLESQGMTTAGVSIDDRPLVLDGTTYTDGVMVLGKSRLVYEIKPEYQRFVAVVGLNDKVKGSNACVIFKVLSQGAKGKPKQLAVSPKLRARPAQCKWHFDIPIPANTAKLYLEVEDADEGAESDHADWADAGFVTTPK